MKKIAKLSFILTFAAAIYIVIVGFFMSHANTWFPGPDNFVTAIAVLMLLTLSALVVGALLIGKPIMLYLDGKKKEAVVMIIYSGAWLFLFFIITLIVLKLSHR